MPSIELSGIPSDATHRHYKGGFYTLLYIAEHTETRETLVVYRSCEDGKIWVRPAEMFDEVMSDGRRRFSPLT